MAKNGNQHSFRFLLEHYWDEGYGYLYGYNNEHVGGSDNNANGPAEGHGVLVNKYLKKSEIEIIVDLDQGLYVWNTWTCDFTKEYVSINADYRS